MTETQTRIKALKASLPGLKERVLAVALLLVMSAAMMTSATYAWLTISLRPELTGVNTTVAANGSLEIALATGDGKNAPGESKVGDSSAAEGQTITGANITWGNLVNLGDPMYGLDNLTLRPAQLNTAALLTSPLYGALYGADGRITQLSSDFGYATWVPKDGDKPGYFSILEDVVGVRAISSTKVEAVGAEAKYVSMVKAARDQNLAAAEMYKSLANTGGWMQSLATMMGLYMTARMNPNEADLSNPDCAIADIQNLRDMYSAFLDCFDAEAEAMAKTANLVFFLKYGDGNYTEYDKDTIYASTTASLKADGIQITDLEQFKKDRNIIASDLEKLKEIASSGTSLKWKDSGLNAIVNNLVNVGACTIGANNTPISSIGASNAASYLSGTQEARITNGILYRFEERTGGYISVKELSISATVRREILGMPMTVPATVKANIQTTAPRDYNLFTNDLTYAESLNDGTYEGGVAVAKDTYGLAVDFWVRTNADSSFLTLEGNLLTESDYVRGVGKDINGNEVELYTITIKNADGSDEIMDVYEAMGQTLDQEGNVVEKMLWHYLQTHTPVPDDELNGQNPTPKMVEVITVLGYEGENRVWNGDENKTLLSTDATTQGSGSCYVYYADTPEDQARSLELLEAFRVAFVNDEGKLIATALMDTEHYYASSGRVIVPLVLDPSSGILYGNDSLGNPQYAIAALEKNVPMRLTAIIYLDGTLLSNDKVLSAAEIQGQLNIQFGSSKDLTAIENEELASKELRINASLDKTEFDYETATEPMTTNVTVHVDGDQPSKVSAFFIREINAGQGTREPEMKAFTKNANGDWVHSYTFTSPGKYVLRSVSLDGVEYVLEKPQTVIVHGFTVKSLRSAQGNNIKVMTANTSTSVDLELEFGSSDPNKMPKTVQGRYLEEDGSAVNVDFTYKGMGKWGGTVTFRNSGNYTLQYLLLDGKYTELEEGLWQHANITLGMRVAVYTTSPHRFKYVPSEMAENEKMLAMQVSILDNAGNEMLGLTNVSLTYTMKGSASKKMYTELVWNGRYYVGNLTTEGPGVWQFGNVVVTATIGEETQTSTLTTATTYPVFTIQSPEPPEYESNNTIGYQFKPNNDATMSVLISNSSAATVQAYITKAGASEGQWVDGTIGQETTVDGKTANYWNFAVPKDVQGYQDGNWSLTELRLWDVFAADGTAYTEEEPLVIDVSGTNNVTKVVSRVYITFAENKSADFGKNADGEVTGTFMQEYPVSGIGVSIKDFEGKPVGATNVKLSYVYGNNSQTYGGYTSGQLTNALADFEIILGDSGNGVDFVQSGTYTLRYAGSYTTTFSFMVNNTTVTYTGNNLPANAPRFTVSSVVPTITIKERSNYDGSSTDGRTVTVTYKYSTQTDCGVTSYNYDQASVTLTLAGYGFAESAALPFVKEGGGDVELYPSREAPTSRRTDRYAWTGDGDCTRWVGFWDAQTGTDKKTPAGTIRANAIVLGYDGIEYTVDIEEIVIINPTPPG